MNRFFGVRPAALLLGLVVLAGMLSGCGGGGGTTVTAQFRDAAGLFDGNDVGVLGVRVGSVTKVTPVGDHVNVTLHVDPGVKIPANAGAVVVSRSVATDRYVELTPVYDSGPVLRTGTVLPMAKTRTPVEFDDLLSSLKDISSTVAGPKGDAAPLNALLGIGAKTLDGKGAELGTTLHNLAKALTAADDGSGDLTSTFDNLDKLTAALADNDALVREFSSQVTSATSMLDDQHASIESTFDALAAMVTAVADFAHSHREQISDQLDSIASLSSAILDHSKDLEGLVTTLPLMMQNVQGAIDSDNHLVFRTRPADLLPGKTAAGLICAAAPANVCANLDLDKIPLFDLLNAIAGVKSP
jgi:phospholipid/cholesterol/gamma-HCH transport system substrate-binding protein